ncbi:MAG TPA: hypothetical protein VGX03_33650 [Candidatus Binatia bacterium]|nr:hypothetical protein [Candidatus Binatia bacterium]
MQAKKQLIHYVNRETNIGMDVNVCTLGFARRAAAYKRADLLFDEGCAEWGAESERAGWLVD